ncbi:hypothetical protein IQ06DRAFT_139469 [Phaeosphaeriaceae sp. SRC1lsM3a]|nr:hypothetical protein IQ06DRAFT_139469 [Stagonospora sp. SRC1lsM3a]
MASTETLSRTPPIPPRNPFRRLSTHAKLSPCLPAEPYHIETELIPKPLFSRRATLPPKTCHVITVELPSPGLSPIILPSDTSTISSNRSSIISVSSSRPSTATTFVQTEPSSRTASLTSASFVPVWVPPPHVAKPLFGRSNTLPSRATRPATAATSTQRPVTSIFSFEPSIKVPALKLPPTRTSCFSPAPVWTPPKRAPDSLPKRPLRRKETPRKETLRSLRAKDSVSCLQASPVRQTPVRSRTDPIKKTASEQSPSPSNIDSVACFQTPPDRKTLIRSKTDTPKKTAPPKPISLSNMRTYSMDSKGVFILSD